MPEDHFGEEIAEHYDADAATEFDAATISATVEFLAALADGGAALELGVGTGRIALPLSQRGVAVRGIDLSSAMVARLRGKPGAEAVDVTIGDFASVTVPGTFALVYLVFNTIMNLTTQDEQVECFANAARHLGPGGRFVIEVLVPDLQRLARGERYRPFSVTDAHLGIDEYDVVAQSVVSHHYSFRPEGTTTVAVPFRYVWPAELDLMARLAGMRLEGRWSGWSKEPFTAESTSHVSVWRLPGAGGAPSGGSRW